MGWIYVLKLCVAAILVLLCLQMPRRRAMGALFLAAVVASIGPGWNLIQLVRG